MIADADRFGVYGHAQLVDDAGEIACAPADVAQLAELAAARNLRRVFVAHDALAALRLPRELPEHIDTRGGLPHRFIDDATARGFRVKPAGLASHVSVAIGKPARRYGVELVPYGDSPFRYLRAADLRRALVRFRELVGVAWRTGAGATAEALIEHTHPVARGGVQLRSHEPAPPPARVGRTETPYAWRRELTAEERRRPYVHVYDLNAQYLAAWASLSCGLGELEHLRAPIVERAALGELLKLPGYWKLAAPLAPLDGLPSPAPGEWHHAETLRLIHELGVDYRVVEGYVWRRHSRYLDAAYRRLRNARETLVDEARAALGDERRAVLETIGGATLGAVKRLYAVQTGRLAGGFRSEHDRWARPDWRHGIIARARCNLYRRLRRLYAPPFAIHVDAIAVASSSEDATRCALAIGLPLGSGLGEFHHVLTAPLQRAELAQLRSSGAVMEHLREVSL